MLTGRSEPITITNNSGTNVYTFTGNGTFIFTFQDASGNTGEATATVTRIDKIKPIVTVSGADVIAVEFKATYNEYGASWTDNVDGSGTNVVISGIVNT